MRAANGLLPKPAEPMLMMKKGMGSYYSRLESVMKVVAKCQKRIEKETAAEISPFYFTFKKIVRGVKSAVGIKQLSLEDLFDIQINNVAMLRSELESILAESKVVLDSLESYSRALHCEFKTALHTSQAVRENFGFIIGRYNKLSESVSKNRDVSENSSKYPNLPYSCKGSVSDMASAGIRENVENKIMLLNARKELDNCTHSYLLANESIADISDEINFLSTVEPVFRMSIHICERVVRRTMRLERHIHYVKRVYEHFKLHQTAVEYLRSAVGALSNFTYHVNESLVQGFRRMSLAVADNNFPTGMDRYLSDSVDHNLNSGKLGNIFEK